MTVNGNCQPKWLLQRFKAKGSLAFTKKIVTDFQLYYIQKVSFLFLYYLGKVSWEIYLTSFIFKVESSSLFGSPRGQLLLISESRPFWLTAHFAWIKILRRINYKCFAGVNFINVLWAALTRADPKSTKKTDNLTVFLCIWDLRM